MKKILTVFNTIDTPWHVITFANKFAKTHSSDIHAVFLIPDKEKINSDYPFPNDLSITEELTNIENVSNNNTQLINDKIKVFKEECELEEIPFTSEKNISISQLIQKTDEFDLLIANLESDFLKNIWAKIDCAILLPSKDEMFRKVIFIYHSPSDEPAIEKYISLYPEYKNISTYLLSINTEKADEKEMEMYIKEKIKPHFSELIIKSLHEKEMEIFLSEFEDHILIVTGGFEQRILFGFIHHSLIHLALKQKNISLFISHK